MERKGKKSKSNYQKIPIPTLPEAMAPKIAATPLVTNTPPIEVAVVPHLAAIEAIVIDYITFIC